MAETKNETLLTMAEVAQLTSLLSPRSGVWLPLVNYQHQSESAPPGAPLEFKLSEIQQYLNNL